MKTRNIIRTLILSGIIGICSSCIEDYKYEEVTGAPQVAFTTSETENIPVRIYTVPLTKRLL